MKRIKNKLFKYMFYKKKLENINLELERIKTEYKGISGMSFDCDGGGGTNVINRKVENEVMQRLDKIKQLEGEKRILEIKIEQVDNSLSILGDIERRIIELRYFDGLDAYTVADEVGLSYSRCLGKQRDALELIAHVLV